MPVSVTKGSLSEECIQNMAIKAFGCRADNITELGDGFFNIAYRLLVNQRHVILKVAPPNHIAVMTHEKNIMFSEVDAMAMVKRETQVPVPQLLFYDDSHSICQRSYFFMEEMKGEILAKCMDKMTKTQLKQIYESIGKYTRQLNELTNEKFGYYCQQDKQGKDWFFVFYSMIRDTYMDAQRKHIHIPVEENTLLSLLERDKAIFEEVKEPKFVHWDIWAGNVFVQGEKVVGLIDFERCLWADELMEVGFRTYEQTDGFFDGYGIKNLTTEQTRRAKWYDVYLFLIACLECDYRKYDNTGAYDWGSDMLKRWVKEYLDTPVI